MGKKANTSPDNYRLLAVADAPDTRDKIYRPALIELQENISPDRSKLNVRDQGQEGACTGFGLASVIDYLNARRGKSITVSTRMLYEMAQRHDEWRGENYEGSSCRGAIKGWYHMGVCSEKSWPYDVHDKGELTVARAKEARLNTLGAYYRVSPNIVDFHSALNETGVLYVSASVHAGWWTDSVKKNNGVIPFRKTTEGGHAFAIVGYNAQGFIVQNSWGYGWGNEGLAVWLYEDWQQNIDDAWVLRLALPIPSLASRAKQQEAERSSTGLQFIAAPSRSEIAGHFAHIDDGEFRSGGNYWSNREDVKQTASLLATTSQYKHVLLYAHGGLNSSTDSARRIAATKAVFKENGIYPFHFMYDTGLLEEISDILSRKGASAHERAGGLREWRNRLIENMTRPIGRALWREMKQGACSPFEQNGAGSQVLDEIVNAVQRNSGLKLHVAGHSNGANLVAHLLQRCATLFQTQGCHIATTTLMAPACTTSLFESHIAPHLTGQTPLKIDEITLYNLTDEQEQDDNVIQLYTHSLLYLVSRAFEEKSDAPILGMQRFSSQLKTKSVNLVYSHQETKRCLCISHGSFDNDIATMNDILRRVLGREPERLFTSKDLTF